MNPQVHFHTLCNSRLYQDENGKTKLLDADRCFVQITLDYGFEHKAEVELALAINDVVQKHIAKKRGD